MLKLPLLIYLVPLAGVTSFLTALGALWVANFFGDRKNPRRAEEKKAVVLLFDGTDLIDANEYGRTLLTMGNARGSPLDRFLSTVGSDYPGLPEAIAELPKNGTFSIRSRDGGWCLEGQDIGGKTRVSIRPQEGLGLTTEIETHQLRALEDEVASFRTFARHVPFLVWRQTAPQGPVTWASRAYIDAAAIFISPDAAQTWPTPVLFGAGDLERATQSKTPTRISVPSATDSEQVWFDCIGVPVDDEILFSAVNVDAAVSAEAQRRAFLQTLTKTFAHLSAGLALFDAKRRLVLFNPALIDLTGLPAEFLSGQPRLVTVLDRLRDRQMIPEPRDYSGWRRHLEELEVAAADGNYSETWSLPNGRTFRVNGRPHPDGAIAFVLEDISAEMALTRQFRSELDIGQSVLDRIDEAIVVFGSNGQKSLSNMAYDKLWHAEGSEAATVTESSRIWMALSRPSPIWGDLRDFVLHARHRVAWNGRVQLVSGERLHCRVEPLSAGATLVGFSPIGMDTARSAGLRA